MAKALDRTTVQTPALELIDAALVDVASGECDRLILSMPPQEGKSERASRRFPLFLLANDPQTRVAVVSYSDEMARRWGAEVKRDLEENPQIGIRLRPDSKAAGRWQIDGARGGVYCVGIAGSLTGKPVDCVRGDTEVLTEYGYARIDQIHSGGVPYPRVLSYDHSTGKPAWRRVIASRAIADRPIVEVVTASGRVVRCTPDHRLYVAGVGYVPAGELRAGQRLVTASAGAGEVRALRQRGCSGSVAAVENQDQRPTALLEVMPGCGGVDDVDVRGLRRGVREAAGRSREGSTQGLRPQLLHESLLSGNGVGAGSRPADPTVFGASVPPGRADIGCHSVDFYGPSPLLHARSGSNVGRYESEPGVRGVRHSPQGQSCPVSEVLGEGTRGHVHNDAVRTLWERIHPNARRDREGRPQWSEELILLARLLREGAQGQRLPMPEMRASNRVEGPRTPILFQRLPTSSQPGWQGTGVPAVRARVLPEEFPRGVLRSDLRQRRTFGEDGWRGELTLQGWDELHGLVPQDASSGLRTRRRNLPSLRDGRPHGSDRAGGCVPDQRATLGQPTGEPDHALSAVSHGSPQVQGDTVSVVRELRGARDVVYDIQVDGTNNFFADEVLVHNCLIIDDPIKDLEQAQSDVYRERFTRFWQGVAVPRLGPGARAVLISTRWHEEDAAGWLIQREGRKEDGGRWTVINIPAQAEESGCDPLGRAAGEYMISARGERDWEGTKKSVGAYVWAALYQGRPAPAEGGLFKRLWWRYYVPAPQLGPSPRIDLGGSIHALDDCWRFATVDLANSTRTSADWTVISAWARTMDGDLVLLDRHRSRIGQEAHFAQARPLVERWRLDTLFVEESQFGTTLVRDATRSGVPISPLKAETDKLTRALPASTLCSNGRVWLPAGASWLDEWISEMAAFPNGSHDDQVDTLAYAVRIGVTGWQPMAPRVATSQGRDPLAGAFGGVPVDLMNTPL